MLKNNLLEIERVANAVLKDGGFTYTCKAKLVTEEFPTRVYDGFTLEQGIYDALILELGSAKGDNWWCVVYPPLCFASPNGKNVVYKSKIAEIIRRWQEKRRG
jgi:stage II sporulation protein R